MDLGQDFLEIMVIADTQFVHIGKKMSKLNT